MSYSLEEVIRENLLKDLTVSGMIDDRFYAVASIHDNTLPFATFILISAPEDADLDGKPSVVPRRIQLSFMSDDWKEAKEVMEQCRRVALAPEMRGTWNGITIDAVYVADKRDMGQDDTTNWYRHDLDLEVWEQI